MGKTAGTFAVVKTGSKGGETIFLNLLPRYNSAKEDQRKMLREWLGERLALAGLQPPLRVTRTKDRTPLPCEVNEFLNGDMRLFGLMRPLEDDALEDPGLDMAKLQAETLKATVVFPKAWHLYDVREHEYLGRGTTTKRELPPGCATLLAAVPYKLTALRLKMPSRANRGETLPYQIRLETGGRIQSGVWGVRMEVEGPDGKPVLACSGQRALTNGVFEGRLPLALNDPVGKWKVKVFEPVSGLSHEVRFTVRSATR
ncbi:MAG: hypothetical protein PHR35_13860 [Kiritimatiellae bacterium]|nr:hypothetical protein [Kiritimatiellia bacterium]